MIFVDNLTSSLMDPSDKIRYVETSRTQLSKDLNDLLQTGDISDFCFIVEVQRTLSTMNISIFFSSSYSH